MAVPVMVMVLHVIVTMAAICAHTLSFLSITKWQAIGSYAIGIEF